MKRVAILTGLALLVGCAPSVETLRTEDGKLLGYMAGYSRTSPDACGHLLGAAIYDADGKFLTTNAAVAPGVTCAAVVAGAMVGGAALLNPASRGDSISASAESSPSNNSSAGAASFADAEASSSSKIYAPRDHYQPPKKPLHTRW